MLIKNSRWSTRSCTSGSPTVLSLASSPSPFSSSSTWSSRLLLCSLWWFWMTAKKQITQDRLDRCDLNSVAGDLSGLNLNSRWFIGLWHEGHAWKGAATATGEIQQWLWVFNIFVSFIYLLSFVFFCPFCLLFLSLSFVYLSPGDKPSTQALLTTIVLAFVLTNSLRVGINIYEAYMVRLKLILI